MKQAFRLESLRLGRWYVFDSNDYTLPTCATNVMLTMKANRCVVEIRRQELSQRLDEVPPAGSASFASGVILSIDFSLPIV